MLALSIFNASTILNKGGVRGVAAESNSRCRLRTYSIVWQDSKQNSTLGARTAEIGLIEIGPPSYRTPIELVEPRTQELSFLDKLNYIHPMKLGR